MLTCMSITKPVTMRLVAFRGHKDMAQVLLGSGANVNAKANNGARPVAMAAQRGNKHLAELLRRHGGHE